MTNKNTEFSQGVCQDGAAILKDGQMMTIEEILAHLRYHHRLREALEELLSRVENDGDSKSWFLSEQHNARTLLAELDNLKNGS